MSPKLRAAAALVVLSTPLSAIPSGATLPPCVYDELVAEAVIVLQLTDPRVERRGRNICRLTGTVAVVHRGDVSPGQSVTADFACAVDRPPTIGGTVYHAPDGIGAAGAVELHIDASGHIAGEGIGLIALDAVTDRIAWQPYCGG